MGIGNWIKIHIDYESSMFSYGYESSDVLITDCGIANSHIMGTCQKMRALK
jgi:hypothetical protein